MGSRWDRGIGPRGAEVLNIPSSRMFHEISHIIRINGSRARVILAVLLRCPRGVQSGCSHLRMSTASSGLFSILRRLPERPIKQTGINAVKTELISGTRPGLGETGSLAMLLLLLSMLACHRRRPRRVRSGRFSSWVRVRVDQSIFILCTMACATVSATRRIPIISPGLAVLSVGSGGALGGLTGHMYIVLWLLLNWQGLVRWRAGVMRRERRAMIGCGGKRPSVCDSVTSGVWWWLDVRVGILRRTQRLSALGGIGLG
jgi:hypothetical protein